MTSGERKRAIVDTCVLVAILNDEDKDEQRAERGVHLLDLHENGWELLMPELVPLEVAAFARRDIAKKERRIRKVKVALELIHGYQLGSLEISSRVTRMASDLIAAHSLKAPDAIIVASGLAHNADAVFTWDGNLIDHCSDIEGIQVVRPPELPVPEHDLFNSADINDIAVSQIRKG